jgi:carotenoid cleavage dioxygenase
VAWPVAAQPAKASAVSRGSVRQTEFAKALLAQPWLVGYAHSERERYQADAKVNGVWPERLQGTLYRNGPAAHELGNYRYSHWFDGDGLMHAYRIRNNQVSHQAAYVNTTKRQARKTSP